MVAIATAFTLGRVRLYRGVNVCVGRDVGRRVGWGGPGITLPICQAYIHTAIWCLGQQGDRYQRAEALRQNWVSSRSSRHVKSNNPTSSFAGGKKGPRRHLFSNQQLCVQLFLRNARTNKYKGRHRISTPRPVVKIHPEVWQYDYNARTLRGWGSFLENYPLARGVFLRQYCDDENGINTSLKTPATCPAADKSKRVALLRGYFFNLGESLSFCLRSCSPQSGPSIIISRWIDDLSTPATTLSLL